MRHVTCDASGVPLPRLGIGSDQRRAPRVEVLMRVKGELVSLDTPIVIHDLSRTGFAAISEKGFETGQTLDFRLVADGGPAVRVTARAVHSRPAPRARGAYITGFMFLPGKLTGLVPQALIDQLIEAVTEPVPCF